MSEEVLRSARPQGETTLAKALNAGLSDALAADDRVVLMGEDVGTLGGVFRITDGLKAQFGGRRVIDTPLAESGIVGTAIGMAMRGYRPCVEIQFDGFSAPAFDQIVSQLARYRARVGGRWSLPVTIRIPFGGGVGSPEHHSESPEASMRIRLVSRWLPAPTLTTPTGCCVSPLTAPTR